MPYRFAIKTDGVRVSPDSRYRNTAAVVDTTNQRKEFALWVAGQPFSAAQDYTLRVVTEQDIGRLDRVAAEYYGRADLWWVIADANNIVDALSDLVPGMTIRVPGRAVVNAYFAGPSSVRVSGQP